MSEEIHVYPTPAELVSAAAEMMIGAIAEAVAARGHAMIALSGGTTPRGLYQALAEEPYRTRVPWDCVHLFWGDERMVPPEHAQSNFRMAKETLVDHVPIPAENVHRVRGEAPPEEAATKYAEALVGVFAGQPPRFDVVLLGLGTDGHTASLFPGADALGETKAPVATVFMPSLDGWRVTLTFPVLNAARRIIFLVSGVEKAAIVARVITSESPAKRLPATLVRPENGHVHWMLDAQAASLIQA